MDSRNCFRPLALIPVLIAFLVSDLTGSEKPSEEVAPVVAKSEKAKVRAKKSGGQAAEEKAAKPADAATPAGGGKTLSFYTVKAGPFEQKVKLSGTIESTGEVPVEIDLKRWVDMTVIKAVPHGATVKKGDILIELDSEHLKKKIDELKADMPLKELELSAAELDLGNAEKSTPLALEKARREKMQAEEDLAHFEDKSRPMKERAAKEEMKDAVESLAYAEEELKQLKKMYEQDDLTEETEEIILRRAENTVARLRWQLEQTNARSTRVLETLLAREHEALKSDFELREISWRAGEKSLRESLEKKRLETSLKRRQTEELRKSLIEHEEDLAAMKVRAPQGGIVYYGMSQRGKWTTASLVEKKLIPGGKLSMREIVMTVVDPSKLQVRLLLNEDQLKDLSEGQTGTVVLKWKPDHKFSAKVTSILHVPYADRSFDGTVSVEIPGEAPKPLPGMTAMAEILVYKEIDALTVPRTAVKKTGEKESVTLKGGKTTVVKTGRSDPEKIEILEGLRAGDVIELTSEPEKKEAVAPAKGEEPGKVEKPEPAREG